ASIAYVSQVTRAAVRTEARKPHVETARARGLPDLRITRRDVMRNAAIPITTVSALAVASLIAGAVVVETAFGLGGVGLLFVQSVSPKAPVVVLAMGSILMLAFVLATTAVDVIQYSLDPRLRKGSQA